MASKDLSKSSLRVQWSTTRDRASRMQLLARIKAQGEKLPLSFVDDMLCLGLSSHEKCALLDCIDTSGGLGIEHFLLGQVPIWTQDLAATALRLWADKTDGLLWYRLVPLMEIPHLPQRVRYTIIDLCWKFGASQVATRVTRADGLEELSHAFHGIILQRAVQTNFQDPRLDALALRKISTMTADSLPDDKSVIAALVYAARFAPTHLRDLAAPISGASPWIDVVRNIDATIRAADDIQTRLEKLAVKSTRGKAVTKAMAGKQLTKLLEEWPAVWQRSGITSETLEFALTTMLQDPVLGKLETSRKSSLAPTPPAVWEMVSGTSPASLAKAVCSIEDHGIFAKATQAAWSLLDQQGCTDVVASTKKRLDDNMGGHPETTALLHPALRLACRVNTVDETTAVRLEVEQRSILSGKLHAAAIRFEEFPVDTGAADPDDLERRAFFDLAWRGRGAGANAGFWGLLSRGWKTPDENVAAELATAARQAPDVHKLAYMSVLGRFTGIDFAALKLLDFARSSEEDELRGLIRALAGIATPRARQELIACLTRPNFRPALQIEILQILREQDLSQLQAELRSAMRDLNLEGANDAERVEIRETLSELIAPSADAPVRASMPRSKDSPSTSDADLDQMLGAKLPRYKELSSEVKRALRTAQFFHLQVKTDGAPDTIDLSPVIDMQYKALELLFREMFEETCSDLISQGLLQRKLDVIGYARPIPHAMDEFENFIGSLPVVREIPFFSKFKLRKMLRAICQFRPGKRFTLDGLKAFALFFLCFGRKECRYGLQGICNPGFATDADLAQFSKVLHVFQDFRNRAAHEGFHPDASNDIDGIWQNTAEIVQGAFKVKASFDAELTKAAPKSPTIQRRVS